jgi:hypothetical protein
VTPSKARIEVTVVVALAKLDKLDKLDKLLERERQFSDSNG